MKKSLLMISKMQVLFYNKLLAKNVLTLLFLCFGTAVFAQNTVFINEFSTDPAMNDGSGGEWIELYNSAATPVNIGCWVVSDGQGTVTIPAGTMIGGNDYFLIAKASTLSCATCDFRNIPTVIGDTNPATVEIDLDMATCGCMSGSLSSGVIVLGAAGNTGELVMLYNPSVSTATPVDAVKFDNAVGAYLPTGGNITNPSFGSCASRLITIPDPATVAINTGIVTRGCNTAYRRDTDGGAWEIYTTEDRSNENHPTPGASNAGGREAAYDFEYSLDGGATWIVLQKTGVQDLLLCNKTNIKFRTTVRNFQHVLTTPFDNVGLVGSYFNNNGAIAAWTNVQAGGPDATGVTVFSSNTISLTPSASYSLQWSDYKEGCCGSASPLSDNECYERVKVNVVNVLPMAASKISVTCPTDFTAGNVNLSTLMSGGFGLTYQLKNNAVNVGAPITSGVFSIPNSLSGPLTVVVTDASACSAPVTISINNACRAVPICPELKLDVAGTTAAGAKCPDNIVTICIDKNSTDLPLGGVINFYAGNAAGFAIAPANQFATKPVNQFITYNQDFNGLTDLGVANLLGCTGGGGTAPNTAGLDAIDGSGADWKLASSNNNFNVQDLNTGVQCGSYGAIVNFLDGANNNGVASRASASTLTNYFGMTYTVPTLPCTGTIKAISIAYTAKQLATGYFSTAGNPALGDQNTFFEYSTSTSTIGAAAGYTNVAALDLHSINDGVAGQNNFAYPRPAPTAAISGSITGLSLSAGNTITFRWRDPDDPGNDHIMGIDDLKMTFLIDGGNCSALCQTYTIPLTACGQSVFLKAQVTPFDAACTLAKTITAEAGAYTVACPTATMTGVVTCVAGVPTATITAACTTCPAGAATVNYTRNTAAQTAAVTYAASNTFTTTASGDYALVNVLPASGCKATGNSTFTLTIPAAPVSGSIAGGGSLCENLPVVLTTSGGVAANYEWSLDNFATTAATGQDFGTTAPPAGASTTVYARAVNGPCKGAIVSAVIDGIMCAVVLPINLTAFNATKQNKEVALNWLTQTELNNNYFEVQRSADGVTFATIGAVRGAGTTNVAQKYNLIDTKPLRGINYYRLNQVDFDGKQSFSPTVSVSMDDKVGVDIMPNPAYNSVTVAISGESNIASVRIADLTGRVLSAVDNISNNQSIDISQLPQGVYFMQISVDKQTYVRRLVKM